MLTVLCVRRTVWLLRLGFIPAVGAANPPFMGGDVSDQRACQLPVLLRPIFLRGLVGRRVEEASHVCRPAMGLARAFDLCSG